MKIIIAFILIILNSCSINIIASNYDCLEEFNSITIEDWSMNMKGKTNIYITYFKENQNKANLYSLKELANNFNETQYFVVDSQKFWKIYNFLDEKEKTYKIIPTYFTYKDSIDQYINENVIEKALSKCIDGQYSMFKNYNIKGYTSYLNFIKQIINLDKYNNYPKDSLHNYFVNILNLSTKTCFQNIIAEFIKKYKNNDTVYLADTNKFTPECIESRKSHDHKIDKDLDTNFIIDPQQYFDYNFEKMFSNFLTFDFEVQKSLRVDKYRRPILEGQGDEYQINIFKYDDKYFNKERYKNLILFIKNDNGKFRISLY